MVRERGFEDLFEIDSAGTHAYHVGESPNANARKVAQSRGIQLEHRARQFNSLDYADFDYIFPMDEENRKGVLELARNSYDREKVFLFREFDPEARGEQNPSVPDPYYGGVDGFEKVQDIMDRTSITLLDWLVQQKDNR